VEPGCGLEVWVSLVGLLYVCCFYLGPAYIASRPRALDAHPRVRGYSLNRPQNATSLKPLSRSHSNVRATHSAYAQPSRAVNPYLSDIPLTVRPEGATKTKTCLYFRSINPRHAVALFTSKPFLSKRWAMRLGIVDSLSTNRTGRGIWTNIKVFGCPTRVCCSNQSIIGDKAVTLAHLSFYLNEIRRLHAYAISNPPIRHSNRSPRTRNAPIPYRYGEVKPWCPSHIWKKSQPCRALQGKPS
jgi:hypothetical protein